MRFRKFVVPLVIALLGAELTAVNFGAWMAAPTVGTAVSPLIGILLLTVSLFDFLQNRRADIKRKR